MKIHEKIIYALACFLAFAVFMLSVHAKDLVHYGDMAVVSRVEYRDISEKAASELHDHVDKQVLKSFAKTFGDNITFSRGREDSYLPDLEEDPGLWGRLHETILLWRVYASLPFALVA